MNNKISMRATVAKESTIPQTLVVEFPASRAIEFIESSWHRSVGDNFSPNENGEWEKYLHDEIGVGEVKERVRELTQEEKKIHDAFQTIRMVFKNG